MFDIFFCIVAITLTGVLSFAACYHATIWVKLNADKVSLMVGHATTTSTKLKADVQSFAVRHGATPWGKFKTEFLDFLRRYGLKSRDVRDDDKLSFAVSDGPMVWSIPEPVAIFVLSMVVCILVLNVAQLFLGAQAPLGDFTAAYILAMLAVSGLSGLYGWSKAVLKTTSAENVGGQQKQK
jgi:hypothetical protein